MSDRPRDWLPAEAAERPAVRARVDAAVAAWSQAWIVGEGVHLEGWALASTTPVASVDVWRTCAGGLRVCCSPRASLRLAVAALGTRAEDVELTDRDRVLLSALGERMIDDLVRRLRDLPGPEGGAAAAGGAEPRVVARLADGTASLFAVSLPLPLVTRLARQALPAPRPAASRPAQRATSIAKATVRLEATLGGVQVDLVQLRGLAVGDVLVLDRALADPIQLSVAGVAIGCGALSEVDGRSALILQTSE
jgi:flagellar motor switch/type III secretory pathway protein FliN